jgi:hypothetical protein
MEKVKRKTSELNSRRYWLIFLPLAIVLLICLRFPIRITLPDLTDDILLYGSISLVSLLVALRIYVRSKWAYRRLLAVVLLCSALAGWQLIDLGVLRAPRSGTFCYDVGYQDSYIGYAYYSSTFKIPESHSHFLLEYFIGNDYIAIAYEVQHPTWWPCGG